MTMTDAPTADETTTRLLAVLADLSDVLPQLQLDDRTPTPCADLNYSELLQHVVGWLAAFTDGLTSSTGRCSDPDNVVVMGDGSHQVERCLQRLAEVLPTVPDDRPLYIGEMGLPTSAALSMILLEYQLHGWDLAVSAGLPWSPGDDGVEASLAFAPATLTPDVQGPGKSFGPRVQVGPQATPFQRLLALAGRDPHWGAAPEPPEKTALGGPLAPPGTGSTGTGSTGTGSAGTGSTGTGSAGTGSASAGAADTGAGRGPRVASGTFTVTEFTARPFEPAVETGVELGYTVMRKEFHGAVEGWSQTQFVSAFDLERGRGSYIAMESFTGTVDGRQGTFNLAHSATTFGGPERAHEFVLIVPFSGTGELAGITGSGAIRVDADDTHRIELYYQLAEGA